MRDVEVDDLTGVGQVAKELRRLIKILQEESRHNEELQGKERDGVSAAYIAVVEAARKVAEFVAESSVRSMPEIASLWQAASKALMDAGFPSDVVQLATTECLAWAGRNERSVTEIEKQTRTVLERVLGYRRFWTFRWWLQFLPSIGKAGKEQEVPVGSSGAGSLEQEWRKENERRSDLFLAHVYYPSQTPGQKYDVTIFLMRHVQGDEPNQRQFFDVEKAEFYLGPSWGQVFPVAPENGIVGVRVEAWGTFRVSCRVTFKGDAKPVIVHRYVDFEMSPSNAEVLAWRDKG